MKKDLNAEKNLGNALEEDFLLAAVSVVHAQILAENVV